MNITITLGARWWVYTATIPRGSRALGIVTRDGYDTGALVQMPSGIYVQVSAGVVRSLPQEEVAAAVSAARKGSRGGPGRGGGYKPPDGAVALKRYQVTLDDESVQALLQLGDGELSLGIRRAAASVSHVGKDHTS